MFCLSVKQPSISEKRKLGGEKRTKRMHIIEIFPRAEKDPRILENGFVEIMCWVLKKFEESSTEINNPQQFEEWLLKNRKHKKGGSQRLKQF